MTKKLTSRIFLSVCLNLDIPISCPYLQTLFISFSTNFYYIFLSQHLLTFSSHPRHSTTLPNSFSFSFLLSFFLSFFSFFLNLSSSNFDSFSLSICIFLPSFSVHLFFLVFFVSNRKIRSRFFVFHAEQMIENFLSRRVVLVLHVASKSDVDVDTDNNVAPCTSFSPSSLFPLPLIHTPTHTHARTDMLQNVFRLERRVNIISLSNNSANAHNSESDDLL